MSQSEGDIEIKQQPAGEEGIKIIEQPTEIEPPLSSADEGKEPSVEEIEPARVTGKVPLKPGVVKPLLRFQGAVVADVTGYPGWMYTEEDLQEIGELIELCGWTMDPRIQVVASLAGLNAAKFTAFQLWKRRGRPGDLKKASGTGEIERTERPKDEKVIQ